MSPHATPGAKTAKLYVELTCHGFNPGLQHHSISFHEFVRDEKNGKWMWRKWTNVRIGDRPITGSDELLDGLPGPFHGLENSGHPPLHFDSC